jgi:hypothetical protein
MLAVAKTVVINEHDSYYHKKTWKAGVWCAFSKLPKHRKWGVKCYYDKGERDLCYNRQKLAASYGLAPQTGDKFSVKTSGGSRVYCFITEVVMIVRDYMQKHPYYSHYDDDRFSALRDNLRDKCDLDGGDMHWRNVGLTKDGRMVCIDFSHMNAYDNSDW